MKNARTPLGLAAVLLFVLTSLPVGAAPAKEAAAEQAARRWLAMIDRGDYGGSWHAASGYFKRAIDLQRWRQTLAGVRGPLGAVLNRTLKTRTYATELPGAPDGEYVVIQFDTAFQNKRRGVETITPMLDKDGDWRVSGYFIK
ncbi:MAG: DUF4019 domain-containing protein [Alphaproteobacteria bacterium]|nr:DUF4019 domain-containing protein [Alphaproteobacteria bacterium]MDP6831359.1 DUF4019 domain-containing protein [Alphaproteobacteria bacterium]MDP6875025.1 DUF4019 domain-containing protein [Alphaproteobacteria bacterium]